MDRQKVIELKGIVTGFGTHIVHDGVDLSVQQGEIMGLVGGSGTGKSVLLKVVTGLLRPRNGAIRIFGEDFSPYEEDNPEIRRRWGMLFQDGALFSSLTVEENIMMVIAEQSRIPPDYARKIARLRLDMVGLPASSARKYPSELSGGMRKRAGLARALALDPELLFLDEPTAGLDPIGAAEFDQLCKDLQKSLGLTMLIVTHDLDTLVTICDRIAVLVEKKVQVGTLQEHKNNPNPWMQEYFNGVRARAVPVSKEEMS